MRRVYLLCAILPFITWDFASHSPILRASGWVGVHNCRQRPRLPTVLPTKAASNNGKFGQLVRASELLYAVSLF